MIYFALFSKWEIGWWIAKRILTLAAIGLSIALALEFIERFAPPTLDARAKKKRKQVVGDRQTTLSPRANVFGGAGIKVD